MPFVNKLPELPFEPKFLKVPLSANRFTEYKMGNTLEKNYKYEMLPDVDVGVSLDLIDVQTFAVPSGVPKLDPADERLVSGSFYLSLFILFLVLFLFKNFYSFFRTHSYW